MKKRTKDLSDMMPSEMANYILLLEAAVEASQEDIRAEATHFRVKDEDSNEYTYTSMAELQEKMEAYEVIEVDQFIHLGKKFGVKISESRIEFVDDRIKAEGRAMLHRPN